MEDKTNNLPVKVFHCGSITAATWLNGVVTDAGVVNVHSVKMNKSYKDKATGEWRNTDRFNIEDLPKVRTLADEVYRYFRVRSSEPNDTTSGSDAANVKGE